MLYQVAGFFIPAGLIPGFFLAADNFVRAHFRQAGREKTSISYKIFQNNA
jgi:hypothetical protein